jgi:hypothetical protein
MRSLAGNAELRGRLSRAGQQFVKTMLNPEVAGDIMRRRLEALHVAQGRVWSARSEVA